jgi:type III secretion protein J
LLAACSVPIAAGLDESEANRAVVALEQGGVVAEKAPDPATERRFQVTVSQSDASMAVAILAAENLPPPASPGVLDAMGQNAIVPSRLAEHAKLVTGTAGELERSLRSIDGVLAARVHLAVPPRDALATSEASSPPSAAVLLRHRSAVTPIQESDVQRLVAGAVPGLSAERVSVVMHAAPAREPAADRALARLGPITVSRSSLGSLRLLLGGAMALNLVLIGTVLFVWLRLRMARAARPEAEASQPGS